MQSPFKIFRKHQKVALAAVTLMAMIAFGLGDVIRQMSGPSASQREGRVVFETNIGNLTEMKIHQLAGQRRVVHRFIGNAFMTANPKLGSPQITNMVVRQFGFGGISEPDMLYKWLYRHEADKLGVAISDAQIQDFIDSVTINGLARTFGSGFGAMGGKKLTSKQFQQIVRELQISPKQLFDLLREELEVVTAYRLTLPAPLPSPEKYWEYFQQLNTRQKIAVAAIPVNSFTDKTGDPTDAQIANLFSKYQYEGESAFNGEFRPGFRQPQKVKLQYLEIAYSAAEEKARAGSPITDKEIDDYYEANKATTIWMQEPPPAPVDDKTPIDPDMTPEQGDKTPAKDAVKGPQLDQKKEEKDAKPGDDAGKPESKEEAPKKDDSKEGEKQPECVSSVDDDAKDAADDKPSTAKDDAAKKEDAPQDEPKSEAKDDAADKTEAEKKEPKDADATKGEENPKIAPPELKFKPLDDELRGTIRNLLVEERIKKLMKDAAENARRAMSSVAESFADSKEIKLVDPDEKQLADLEKRSAEELRKIGEKFDMKFGETGLVSAVELSEIPGLGKAYDPDSPISLRGETTTIIEQAFSSDGLCQVFESETLSTSRYVCWKIRDVPAHVPELKDPGIREQVVTAWKRLAALPLAQKRADELAQRARSSGKDLQAALADETVTGTSVGASLVVFTSGEFTFWQDSSVANPMARSRQVQLGSPSGVTNAGRKFMQVVFEQLADGDVGVALNDDASIYYVVKVLERRPADREEFKDAKLFDGGSAYASIAQREFQYAMQEHNDRVREKFAIRTKDLPQRRGQAMQSFDDE